MAGEVWGVPFHKLRMCWRAKHHTPPTCCLVDLANQTNWAPQRLGFLGRRPECETTPFARRHPALARCTLPPHPTAVPFLPVAAALRAEGLALAFSQGPTQSIANSNGSGDTFAGFCSSRSSRRSG